MMGASQARSQHSGEEPAVLASAKEVVAARIAIYDPKKDVANHPRIADAKIVKRGDMLNKEAQKMGSSDKSYILDWGVRLSVGGKFYYRCLVGACGDKMGLSGGALLKFNPGNTASISRHLKDLHQVISGRTEQIARRVQRQANVRAMQRVGFEQNPPRWIYVKLCSWAIKAGIPFSAFKDSDFDDVLSAMTSWEGMDQLSGMDPRRGIVELYLATKERMILELRAAKAQFDGVPFLSINVDLITSDTQNIKYVSVRLSFTQNSHLRGFNLGVRAYRPTTDQLRLDRASDLLRKWVESMLSDFGVAQGDVLTSTSDQGPDVRRLLETSFPTLREWCICHLINLAVVDATGMALDKAKSKNLMARRFFSRVRKVVEKISKSPSLRQALTEDNSANGISAPALKNAPMHRWSAVVDSMERLLRNWSAIERTLPETDFLVSEEKDQLIEMYSLIHPLRRIQRLAQRTKTFSLLVVYHEMNRLVEQLLRADLVIVQPGRTVAEALRSGPTQSRSEQHVSHLTKSVRTELLEALSSRYFDRYHPVRAYKGLTHVTKNLKFNYVFDTIALLDPRCSNGWLIKELILLMPVLAEDVPSESTDDSESTANALASLRDKHFQIVYDHCWKTIKKLAIKVAKARAERRQATAATHAHEEAGPSRKKQRSGYTPSSIYDSAKWKRSPPHSAEVVSLDPAEIVDREICYLQSLDDQVEPEAFLSWWASPLQVSKMPCLSQAALALGATLPSAGGLECDLGHLKDVIKPKRSSLSPHFVEMCVMMRTNKDMIPNDPADVKALKASKYKDAIPLAVKDQAKQLELAAQVLVEDVDVKNTAADDESASTSSD